MTDTNEFRPMMQKNIDFYKQLLESTTLRIGDTVKINICNEKPYCKLLDKLDNFLNDEDKYHLKDLEPLYIFRDDNEKYRNAIKNLTELINLNKNKNKDYIYVVKLYPSHKIIPIVYDDLNYNYKLELCKKLLSFAKLYNRRLSNKHIGFDLDSVGNLFSYHKSDILLVKNDNLSKPPSYMHLVTNNGYKYTSHKTKLICLNCNWKGIFKGYGRAEFVITDDCTLICHACGVDAILEDIYDDKQIQKWRDEGGFFLYKYI